MMYPMVLAACFLTGVGLVSGAVSQLWGTAGEAWSPQSRLPDFSYAGYACGERPIPTVPRVASVRDFGARGDGIKDDTDAFIKAIATVKNGALEVPAGRYKITRILEIKRGNVVLRGQGTDKTILFFPVPLEKIKPNQGATTTGQPTSNYSWSGGMVWISGDYQSRPLATVKPGNLRGDTVLKLSAATGLTAGQWVTVGMRDNPDNALANHLYSQEAGSMSKLKGRTTALLVTRLREVLPDGVRLERPLRWDMRAEWKPELRSFNPSVSEVGIENLCFEFPVTDYRGHFTELGYNPAAINGAVNCWIRNVRVVNADSGFFVSGHFNTVDGVVYESQRKSDSRGYVGHHGVYFGGEDNLFTRFDFRMKFIHDISVSHCAGNVCSAGKGMDLCFDHHKRAPYENLFTDIDLGLGSRPWMCGGGADLGKHSGARETFWNLRAKTPLTYPLASFGPASMNLVGVPTVQPSVTEIKGKWFEAIPPAQLQPQDLHKTQVQKRLKAGQ